MMQVPNKHTRDTVEEVMKDNILSSPFDELVHRASLLGGVPRAVLRAYHPRVACCHRWYTEHCLHDQIVSWNRTHRVASNFSFVPVRPWSVA